MNIFYLEKNEVDLANKIWNGVTMHCWESTQGEVSAKQLHCDATMI